MTTPLNKWTEHYNVTLAQQFWQKLHYFVINNKVEEFNFSNELKAWKAQYGEINSLFYFIFERDIVWLDTILPDVNLTFPLLEKDSLHSLKKLGLVIADSAFKIKDAINTNNLSQVEYLFDNYLKQSRLKVYNGFYGETLSNQHYHASFIKACFEGKNQIVSFLADKQQDRSVLEYAFFNTLTLVTLKNNLSKEDVSNMVHVLYYLLEAYYDLTQENIIDSVKKRFYIPQNGITNSVMWEEYKHFDNHYAKVEVAYKMINEIVDKN